MERLTEKCSAGYQLIEMEDKYCDNYCKLQDFATCRDCAISMSFDKLGSYEDTNLQPKQVEKLKTKYKELQKENSKLKKEMLKMLKYAWYNQEDEYE